MERTPITALLPARLASVFLPCGAALLTALVGAAPIAAHAHPARDADTDLPTVGLHGLKTEQPDTLRLVDHEPAIHDSGISPTSPITLSFSRAVSEEFGLDSHLQIFGALSGPHAWTSSRPSSTTVSVLPDDPFFPGEEVTVSLLAGLTDGDSLEVYAPYVWRFDVATTPSSLLFSDEHVFDAVQAIAVSPADFDHDGDVDLAVAQAGDIDRLNVLLNDGTGHFALLQTLDVPANPVHSTVLDADGDGALDIALGHWSTQMVSVLLGNGDGTFQSPSEYPLGASVHIIVSGDLDGDGHQDLATANRSQGNLSILWNDGTGLFLVDPPATLGSGTRDVDVLDCDADGRLDLAVAASQTAIHHNIGQREFDWSWGTTLRSDAVSGLNLDGQGAIDLVALTEDPSNGEILAFLRGWPIQASDIAVDDSIWPCGAFADYPQRAALSVSTAEDLLFVNYLSGDLQYWARFKGDTNYDEDPPYPWNTGHTLLRHDLGLGDIRNPALADFDGDGDLDLAVAYREGGEVRLFRSVVPETTPARSWSSLLLDGRAISLHALTSSADGSLHILFLAEEGTDAEVVYAHWAGGIWSAEGLATVVPPRGDTYNLKADIAVAESGVVHAAYPAGNPAHIVYAERGATGWTFADLGEGTVAAVALTSESEPVVAIANSFAVWTRATTGLWSSTGPGWTSDSPVLMVDVAVDARGEVHLLDTSEPLDAFRAGWARYARYDGQTWVDGLIFAPWLSSFGQVSTDGLSRPHVVLSIDARHWGTGILHHYVLENGVWRDEVLGGGAFDPSLHMSTTHEPQIVAASRILREIGGLWTEELGPTGRATISPEGSVWIAQAGQAGLTILSADHQLEPPGVSFQQVGLSLGSSLRAATATDYDADGDDDLLLTRSTGGCTLLRNDGDWSFSDMTPMALQDPLDPTGALWFPLNADPLPELIVLSDSAPAQLFLQTLEHVLVPFPPEFLGLLDNTRCVAAADYDLDGDVDLYVTRRSGLPNALLQNQSPAVSFVDVTDAITGPDVSAEGTAWADYDNDGDPDLYVAQLAQPNLLLRNDNGIFTDLSAPPVNSDRATVGIAWGDYDCDGNLDLFLANLDQPDQLLRNRGDGSFEDVTPAVLANAGGSRSPAWVDVDNDGWLDLHVTSGPDASRLYRYFSGLFVDQTAAPLDASGIQNGAAWSDLDHDGDLDVLMATGDADGESLLLENQLDNGNHWLQVLPTGRVSNPAAIGLRLRVVTGSHSQIREIQAGSGFWTQHSRAAHFGLGEATQVDSLVLRWPSGLVQVATNVAADQILKVTEGTSITGVEDHQSGQSARFRLGTAVPNPFNPSTTIEYSISSAEHVELVVFDLAGRRVRTLVDQEMPEGTHKVQWNGRDDSGRRVSSGAYLYRLKAGSYTETRRMVLLK